ncbi:MAG: RNA polymerase subunit sigma [Marinilabiliales bacterium]|nr:MAG: RNA polymerase subunit sigma [Marinilabiliales bacterium]
MRQLKISQLITNRESESLNKYLQDISKIELISTEEEVALAERVRKGDQEATKKLVEANLRFVVSVAKQYQYSGLSLQDLINEGNLGLIKAAHKFDETKGFKFISYAVWWIRQQIMQAIHNHKRTIRLPQNEISNLGKLNKTINTFVQKNEREPSTEELSQLMDIPKEKLKKIQVYTKPCLSFDAPLSQDGDGSLMDVVENNNSPKTDRKVLQESFHADLKSTLNILSDKEKSVIVMYYGLDQYSMTLNEISERLELSKERVRQIKTRAIHKLKNSSRKNKLKEYIS